MFTSFIVYVSILLKVSLANVTVATSVRPPALVGLVVVLRFSPFIIEFTANFTPWIGEFSSLIFTFLILTEYEPFNLLFTILNVIVCVFTSSIATNVTDTLFSRTTPGNSTLVSPSADTIPAVPCPSIFILVIT